jgi:nicotinate-nucleotide adenylyltransferase
MEFFHRATGRPSHLAVFPGAFNPVTVAHLALTRAALSQMDEVVMVLPRIFPHKEYSGASFEARAGMLCAALHRNEPISVAASDRGLFVEIAEECRAAYGPDVELAFLCGRDAAERIIGWDYGRPDALPEMLRQFQLLVAARRGEYEPPDALRAAVQRLELAGEFGDVSASEVRGRIARGEPWEHLVPPEVHGHVRKNYS